MLAITNILPVMLALLISVASQAEARTGPGLQVQTHGSCNMNGALAQCLGYDGKACRYAEYERCTTLSTLRLKADCFCAFFRNQSNCWGQGICCTEYPAHAAVADDVCSYAGTPTAQLDGPTLKGKREAAYAVVLQVCNNDCQTDIPCVDNEPMPRNGQNPNGHCQPRTYWANGKCTGRQMCASYDRKRHFNFKHLS